jgi:hypothetical protein
MRQKAGRLRVLFFFTGLLFCPEGGGDMFLRNVGLCPNYTALQLRIQYFSYTLLVKPNCACGKIFVLLYDFSALSVHTARPVIHRPSPLCPAHC